MPLLLLRTGIWWQVRASCRRRLGRADHRAGADPGAHRRGAGRRARLVRRAAGPSARSSAGSCSSCSSSCSTCSSRRARARCACERELPTRRPTRRARPRPPCSSRTRVPRRIRGLVRDAWQPSAGAATTRWPLDLPGGERRAFRTTLVPLRRGERRTEQVTVRSLGPLGFAGRQVTLREPGRVPRAPAVPLPPPPAEPAGPPPRARRPHPAAGPRPGHGVRLHPRVRARRRRPIHRLARDRPEPRAARRRPAPDGPHLASGAGPEGRGRRRLRPHRRRPHRRRAPARHRVRVDAAAHRPRDPRRRPGRPARLGPPRPRPCARRGARRRAAPHGRRDGARRARAARDRLGRRARPGPGAHLAARAGRAADVAGGGGQRPRAAHDAAAAHQPAPRGHRLRHRPRGRRR